MMSELRWQSAIYSPAGQFVFLESYESVHARLRDAHFAAAGEHMQWPAPIELTVRTESGRPLRMMFTPHAVVAVSEIAPEFQTAVVED